MDASPLNLGISTTGSSLASTGPTSGAAPASSSSVSSFAGIFNTMQPSAGRQDLAAWPQGLQMPSLVSQPLGDGMSVITQDAPSPAQDSLLAFARSQGLDEKAIAALWQPPPVNGSPPGATPGHSNMSALLGVAHGAPGLPVATRANPQNATTNTPTELQAPALPAFLFTPANWTTPSTPTQASTSPSPTTGTANAVQAPTVQAPNLQAPTVPSTADAELEDFSDTALQAQPPKTGAQALAALQLMGLVVEAAPTTVSPAPAQASPSVEADPLTLSQLKFQMVQPQLRNAKPPANAAASEAIAPDWASFMRKEKAGDPEVLDLEADLASIVADRGSDLAATAPASTNAPSSSSLSGANANANAGNPQASSDTSAIGTARVISGFQLKADHYQQLADRMGQLMAQKLQQQIDRGEWSLRLRLNPAELGQIDVQLDMQQGGLNAVFQADNPLTRDLIQQGSGRLKDGLAQSGMTLANVLVNSDGSRQFGGNSTPQRQPRRGSSPPTQTVGASESPAATTRRVSDNNWDMLA